jgi:peroxiredoxin
MAIYSNTDSNLKQDSPLYKLFDEELKKGRNNQVIAFLISRYGESLTYVEVNNLYRTLDPAIKDSYEEKAVARLLNSLAKKSLRKIGSPFYDFASKDTSGNVVDTRSFRGEYTLVVFWASWCVGCRDEHPALNELYEKYKGHGLQMVGVSLDESKNEGKWKQAIIKDKLTWPQVSDLKGFEMAVVKHYQLTGEGVPFNFLIDKDGKILGSKLDIQEIESLLESLLGVSRK